MVSYLTIKSQRKLFQHLKPPQIDTKPKQTTKVSTKKPKQPKEPAPKKPRDKSKPSSKNIVKNYGKAMCSFAASELSMPYLNQIYQREPFDIATFQTRMREKRDDIDSIESVRTLLLVRKDDDEVTTRFKKVFQESSIIFIKYFSVNWIFQGKMSHKQAHLQSRFKMIRRIKNPEFFTYFKEFRGTYF